MMPMRLMKASPTYAVWREGLVRILAREAPEVAATGLRTRREEVYIWAHCDAHAYKKFLERQKLVLPRVRTRGRR